MMTNSRAETSRRNLGSYLPDPLQDHEDSRPVRIRAPKWAHDWMRHVKAQDIGDVVVRHIDSQADNPEGDPFTGLLGRFVREAQAHRATSIGIDGAETSRPICMAMLPNGYGVLAWIERNGDDPTDTIWVVRDNNPQEPLHAAGPYEADTFELAWAFRTASAYPTHDPETEAA